MKAIGCLLAGLVALVVGFAADGRLPARERLVESARSEPLQTPPLSAAAFRTSVGGVDYMVRPVADYDITGLVVSEHDSDAWWDWIHKASNDHLNVVDLCVVWGANAASGAYQRMSFSSGQFVCYWSAPDATVGSRENTRALSNNHLLTDEKRLARLLRGVRIGDQVRIRGQLVEYSHEHGFKFFRGTSTTRDDTGDGACETIFVREAEVLRAGRAWPRGLKWVGALLVVAGVALWFATPHRARH